MISIAQNLWLEWHKISSSRMNIVQFVCSIMQHL